MNTKSLVLAMAVLGLSSGFVLAQETQDKAATVQVVTENTPAQVPANGLMVGV